MTDELDEDDSSIPDLKKPFSLEFSTTQHRWELRTIAVLGQLQARSGVPSHRLPVRAHEAAAAWGWGSGRARAVGTAAKRARREMRDVGFMTDGRAAEGLSGN